MSKTETEIQLIHAYVELAKEYLDNIPDLLEAYSDYNLNRLKTISFPLRDILGALASLNAQVDNVPSHFALELLEQRFKLIRESIKPAKATQTKEVNF